MDGNLFLEIRKEKTGRDPGKKHVNLIASLHVAKTACGDMPTVKRLEGPSPGRGMEKTYTEMHST